MNPKRSIIVLITRHMYKLVLLLVLAIPVFGKKVHDNNSDSIYNFTNAITAQWIGLVFHPEGGTYPHLYIRKLDPKAYFVVEHGLVISYEHRIFERGYLKGAAAYNLDCANVPAGFLHAGLHYQIIRRKKHLLTAGLGPTLVFREDWHQFSEYKSDVFFKERVHGKWQYRFVVFGNIEYNYSISRNFALNVGFIPAGHLLLTFTFGIKYILKN